MKYIELYISDLKEIQKDIKNLMVLQGKSVLVTGASGLIGSALIDFLITCNDSINLGTLVYAGGRNREKLENRFNVYVNRTDFEIVYFNALEAFDPDKDFDYIIHAASPAHPDEYVNRPVETILANINGTRTLLEYCKNNNACRMLYISSSEVYGKKEGNEPYKENDYGYVDISNPRSCYPSSKRAAESLCQSYLKEYGVNTVIVRPGHVYGPTATREDSRASSQFIYNVVDEKDIVMKSDGRQIRSYCYVLDCVSSIMTALLNGKSGEAYNISNPNSICTIRDLAECIAETANMEIVFSNPTDKEKSGYNMMDNSSLDSNKIERLGWKGRFDLNTGIEHTILVIRSHKCES